MVALGSCWYLYICGIYSKQLGIPAAIKGYHEYTKLILVYPGIFWYPLTSGHLKFGFA